MTDFNVRNYLKILEDHMTFESEDIVFHKTDAEMGAGIVLTYRVWGDIGDIEYLVSFRANVNLWCYQEVLTKEKPIDF